MIRTRLVSLIAGISNRKPENLRDCLTVPSADEITKALLSVAILDEFSHVTRVARISYMVMAGLSNGAIPYR